MGCRYVPRSGAPNVIKCYERARSGISGLVYGSDFKVTLLHRQKCFIGAEAKSIGDTEIETVLSVGCNFNR